MTIIERIEGNFAVAETDGKRFDIPLSELPAGIREGDIIIKGIGGYKTDADATRKRREGLAKRSRALFGD